MKTRKGKPAILKQIKPKGRGKGAGWASFAVAAIKALHQDKASLGQIAKKHLPVKGVNEKSFKSFESDILGYIFDKIIASEKHRS